MAIWLSDDGAYASEEDFRKADDAKCQAHVGAYYHHEKEVRLARIAAERAEWDKLEYW
jgi:hypothetical protein